jgi:hypothetical protein
MYNIDKLFQLNWAIKPFLHNTQKIQTQKERKKENPDEKQCKAMLSHDLNEKNHHNLIISYQIMFTCTTLF